MSIKLLLLDLDDTLLDKDLNISAANRRALAAAARKGVRVVLASGRMFRSMRPYAEELELPDDWPIIAYNGGLARPLRGADLWHLPVPNATARAILARLADWDVTPHLFVDDRLYVREWNDWVRVYTANAGVEAETVGDLHAFLADPDRAPTKMLALGDPGVIADLRRVLGKEFADRAEVAPSKPSYLEITARGISKAAALERFMAIFDLQRSETMAVGDGQNDLGMMRAAGIGVAVGNAPPEVRSQVEHVVAPHDRDGVAEAVERFIL